jgi:hypothetical protein
MRPNHLHIMVEVPGYQKLTTAFYPEGDKWMGSDAVFGVKKSLAVVCTLVILYLLSTHLPCLQTLVDIDNEAEARKRGFPKGSKFKLLERDVIMVREEDSRIAREKGAAERAQDIGLSAALRMGFSG